MVKCLVSQQQQGSQLNSLELNPPLATLDNSFMQGTGTHTQVILNLKLPLSHGMDWTELASNICPQGMCLGIQHCQVIHVFSF